MSIVTPGTHNIITRAFYAQLGGSDDPFVWCSVFKLVTIPWKWWQGWHPRIDIEYSYPEDYDEWWQGSPPKKRRLVLRRPPQTGRVEGRNRTRTQMHLMPDGHEYIHFDTVTLPASAGTYVAVGLRANEHDEHIVDITDFDPVTLAGGGVIKIDPLLFEIR